MKRHAQRGSWNSRESMIGKLMVMQGGFGCVGFFLVPGILALLRTVPRSDLQSATEVEAYEQSVPQIDDHRSPFTGRNRTRSTEEQDKMAPSKGHFLNNCP